MYIQCIGGLPKVYLNINIYQNATTFGLSVEITCGTATTKVVGLLVPVC